MSHNELNTPKFSWELPRCGRMGVHVFPWKSPYWLNKLYLLTQFPCSIQIPGHIYIQIHVCGLLPSHCGNRTCKKPWLLLEPSESKPVAHFTKTYELIIETCEFYFWSNFCFVGVIRSQTCTCHDSWAVVTCAKLWPDLAIIFHVRAIIFFFTKFEWWAHKLFVKWAPDARTKSQCSHDCQPIFDLSHDEGI